MSDHEENPVTNGLVALATVAIVVGILGGLGAVVATKVVGLGDASEAAADSTGQGGASLIMPDPVPTEAESGPLVTLAPSQNETFTTSPDASDDASDEPSQNEKPAKNKKEITLSQGAFEVAPGEKLYLSGIYPGGEGSVLDVEYRIDGGAWTGFPVDVSVSNETFSTYVETYKTGSIEWRVVDKATKKVSNSVKVRHG
ncbi:hypothetical protein ACLM5J_03085 [Nocardioides sp. Bht2]|uniref:hypothetical protein n=1 Tax=Nocardioides sp. Bht2 TaxID=3392297 RepID=UPI0039B63D35